MIKANQGKRHFFKPPSIRPTHPLDGAHRQSKARNVGQGSPSPRGEGRGEGERHHHSIPSCSHTQPIKAKNPAIVPHQGLSRQTMKNESSNMAMDLQPTARLLLRHWMLVVRCWLFDVGCFPFPRHKRPLSRARPFRAPRSGWLALTFCRIDISRRFS